jgi:hypothetical protein
VRVSTYRYIEAVRKRNVSGILSTASDGRRIIAMSLYGRDPRQTWGVLRNAQLVPVFFPGWRLRVYVPPANGTLPNQVVPERIVNKLRLLGAEIARVQGRVGNRTMPGVSQRDWRLLVTDDQNVDYFLVRDAESRLNDRDASAVGEWIAEVERRAAAGDVDAFPVHCIRDHPKHVELAIVDGLWGGRPAALRRKLGTRLTTALYRKASAVNVESVTVATKLANGSNASAVPSRPKSTLEEILWPILAGDRATALCHDVVSPCNRWTTVTRRRFPTQRRPNEYLGQKYDEHQELAAGDDSKQLVPEVVCNGASVTRSSQVVTSSVSTKKPYNSSTWGGDAATTAGTK